MADGVYSVSELTEAIKACLETEFPELWLRGEISNFKRHSSGHLYFTLKDASAQINGVIWRSVAQQLSFELGDGLEVLARGRVEVYAPQGKYQIVVSAVKLVGEGDLQKAFELLFEKLKREGLFDNARKKPLPRYPEKIGVVTSPTGAVIKDICSVLARRYPAARIVLFPTRVQGEGAPEEIVAAIRYFNRATNPDHQVDALIVGRGGGSLEDLWAFNDERVARAVFESKIPIVSAVGHETDYTICDFVADARAATPSNAAELISPDSSELLASISATLQTLRRETLKLLEAKRSLVREIVGSYAFNKPLRDFHERLQTLDRLSERMALSVKQKFESRRSSLDALERRLVALGYEQTLRRGFALAFKDGKPVRSAQELRAGDDIVIRFADGEKTARITR
ncbi:MAG: exodeoxyribonuclease VII large subunit [Chloroherpetonaceae bacterium]|nr:exodeoxyribonuclease VII large subunit [Chloroherpetonaceae bacterium]MDW8437627.1 exodeoxyribonuclease VII large subunit [Chloroherpetonaceae bacterium]